MVQKDTQFVMKNSQVQQPFIPTDGLELYYDVKGKKNTDNYKGTLLDMSGNGRHGVLSNFAYEGVSGFTGTTEGGLLLDDVDDKIVRPAISGIEYTSASRNLFNKNGKLNEKPSTDVSNYDTTTYDSVNDLIVTTGVNGVRYGYGQKISVKRNTNYYCSASAVGVQQRISIRKENSTVSPLADFVITAGGTNGRSFNTGDNDFIFIIPLTESITGTYGIKYLQLEENSVATAYTPYIPLPIMTYQMNGNILSFEKDGTVKRTTKDANGNEVVVSRKGINLVRNGNFANGIDNWNECEVICKRDNNALLIQAKQTSNEHYAEQTMRTVSPNSIYYLSGKIEVISGVAHAQIWNRTNDTYENSGGTIRISEGNVNFIEEIITTTTIHETDPHMFIRLQLLPDTIVNPFVGTNESAKFSNIQLINLTEAYGAGNEPTLAYIQSHPEEFAWTPNPNDLIETVEIKNNLVGDLENLQGNDFEQHEDGVVTYTNEAEEGSVVRVDIDGVSDQPLRFRNATGEQVVITEHDQIDTDAIKKIEFQGNSVQSADRYREVSGTSVTIVPEMHDKAVADKVIIGGNTTQYTESSNVVTDGLQMWMSGRNFSNNPATTVWKDLTGANNGVASGFEYRTNVYEDMIGNFAGKIAGSFTENPNYGKHNYNNNNGTLLAPDAFPYEFSTNSYQLNLDANDGNIEIIMDSNNGGIPQQMFAFDLIKMFEKQFGAIPSADVSTAGKASWLDSNIHSYNAKWVGYGICPAGNKAHFTKWTPWNSSWGTPSTNTSNSSSSIEWSRNGGTGVNGDMINSNGFVYLLAYTDASNGVIESDILTDYVELKIVFSGASGSDGSGGVNFDGVDDYITSGIDTLKFGQLTCEMKLNLKSQRSTGWQTFFGGTSLSAFSIGVVSPDYKFSATLTNLIDATSSGFVIPLNTDIHLTATYSTFTKILKYYVNGALVDTVNNAFSGYTPTGSTNLIGSHSGNNTGALNADVKFARIYNRALSDTEVLQNYNAGLTIPIPNIAMPQEVKHVTSGSKVLVHGKNLFDGSKVISTPYGTSTWDGNSLVVTGTYYVQLDIKLKRNTVYCMSAIRTGAGSGSIAIYNGAGQLDTNIASGTGNYTFTTRDYDDYAILLYAGMGTDSTKTFSNIQLEEGVNITSYEPFKGYQETTIPVTLKSIG